MTEYPHEPLRARPADVAGTGPDHDRGVLESTDGRSIGELLGDVTSNLSTLMQQEMALAKAELRQSGSQAGKGIGLLAGGAVAGMLFLVFLTVSAWWGLGQYIGNEWSALIVAVIWAVIALILVQVGKKELNRVRGLDKTTETLSKVPNAIKGHEEENR